MPPLPGRTQTVLTPWILSTTLCEDEIVHGGEEFLARTILEAQELRAPIMFVLSSCGTEIVPIERAGFRGDQNEGKDIALDAILRKPSFRLQAGFNVFNQSLGT